MGAHRLEAHISISLPECLSSCLRHQSDREAKMGKLRAASGAQWYGYEIMVCLLYRLLRCTRSFIYARDEVPTKQSSSPVWTAAPS